MTNLTESRPSDNGTDGTDRRPEISIVMPSYNSERFIGAAINSVLAQDFENFEILVIDDNSTDASRGIVEEYASKDRRVRCLTNQRTKGAAGARNTGLDEARGEWITFLDSDDLLIENCLSARLEFLVRRSDCRILTTDHSSIDETGKIMIDRRFSSNGLLDLARERAVLVDGGFYLERPVEFFLDHFSLMWTGSIMLHSSVIEQTGRFDETLTYGEDLKYWYQAALRNKVFFLDISSVCYRQHGASLTANIEALLKGTEGVYREILKDSEFSAYRTKVNRRLALAFIASSYYYRKKKLFLPATRFAAKSILAGPGNSKAWRNLSAIVFGVS